MVSEHKEQVAVVTWCRKRNILIFAIPNGGKRSRLEAICMKREGVLAGIPDLQIILPGQKVIWIEMKKRKGGSVSKVQKEIHAKLQELGHLVCVAKGAKEAVEYIKEIMGPSVES